MRNLARLGFVWLALCQPVQAQTWAIGVFPKGTTDPVQDVQALRVFSLTVGQDIHCPGTAGPTLETLANPQALDFVRPDGSKCLVLLEGVLLALEAGSYQLAIRFGGIWGDLSLPFTRYPALKTCWDGQTQYGWGTGPAVERMPNSTDPQRAAWLARERQLARAGFDVRTLLVSTSVYFAVTCR